MGIMLKQLFSFIFFVLLSTVVHAQEFNQSDEQGRKQGEWKKFYESSRSLFYEGQFKDDHPIGEFRHYYKNGALRSITAHKGDLAFAKVFNEKGLLISEGRFKNMLKDSTWVFYNAHGDTLQLVNYKEGKKTGQEITFFDNGKTASVYFFIADIENGPFETFFASGLLESKGFYLNGLLDDSLKHYYENGQLMYSGNYRQGLKNGRWDYYHSDGLIKMMIDYNRGIVTKEEFINGTFTTYFDDGSVAKSETYKNGLKNGQFIEYYPNEDQKIIVKEKTTPYDLDELVVETKNHQIKKIVNYTSGKKEGEAKEFESNGKEIKREYYHNGVLSEEKDF